MISGDVRPCATGENLPDCIVPNAKDARKMPRSHTDRMITTNDPNVFLCQFRIGVRLAKLAALSLNCVAVVRGWGSPIKMFRVDALRRIALVAAPRARRARRSVQNQREPCHRHHSSPKLRANFVPLSKGCIGLSRFVIGGTKPQPAAAHGLRDMHHLEIFPNVALGNLRWHDILFRPEMENGIH